MKKEFKKINFSEMQAQMASMAKTLDRTHKCTQFGGETICKLGLNKVKIIITVERRSPTFPPYAIKAANDLEIRVSKDGSTLIFAKSGKNIFHVLEKLAVQVIKWNNRVFRYQATHNISTPVRHDPIPIPESRAKRHPGPKSGIIEINYTYLQEIMTNIADRISSINECSKYDGKVETYVLLNKFKMGIGMRRTDPPFPGFAVSIADDLGLTTQDDGTVILIEGRGHVFAEVLEGVRQKYILWANEVGLYMEQHGINAARISGLAQP